METKRLFIGTFVNHNVIIPYLNELKESFSNIIKGKWVEPENLHFTYKFLGDIEISKINHIKDTLNTIICSYKSQLHFRGLSSFPNLKSPRILFIRAIDQENILNNIFRNIENSLSKLGISREKNPFKPHITLQRIKEYSNPQFNMVINKYSDFDFGKMEYFDVKIIESTLTNSGPIYKCI